jgi:hypothetical protein
MHDQGIDDMAADVVAMSNVDPNLQWPTTMRMPPEKSNAQQIIESFEWKELTWYRAKVARSSANPIFDALIFTGFLSDGKPNGYSGWTPTNRIENHDGLNGLYYLEVGEPLFTAKEW